MAAIEEGKKRRADLMPTEQDAVKALWEAQQRLRELGWKDAQYAHAKEHGYLIEIGSSGIHEGYTDDQRRWWIPDEGDLWPSKPILYKPRDTSSE